MLNSILRSIRRLCADYYLLLMFVSIASLWVVAWQWYFATAYAPRNITDPVLKLTSLRAANHSVEYQIAQKVLSHPSESPGVESLMFDNTTLQNQLILSQTIAERYRLPAETAHDLVKFVYVVSHNRSLDPVLVLAVIGVESAYQVRAKSSAGAVGLMQVMESIHHDKFRLIDKNASTYDPKVNIQVGTLILKDAIARGGGLEGGLQLYVGLPPNSSNRSYINAVIKEKNSLQEVLVKNQDKNEGAAINLVSL